MLKTFEGVIINFLDRPDAIAYYEEKYRNFKQNDIQEQPYINLIYTRYLLLENNSIIRMRKFWKFSYQYAAIRMTIKKHKFLIAPNDEFLKSLCENPNFRFDKCGALVFEKR
jgi:hypothetical protein